MGRGDNELVEAARNGNIIVVEKILTHKNKRSGPLASLRRGPGANDQDNSGYSSLHHASLNGHADVVRILLANNASPNLSDLRGSSPLHLASWAGEQEIVNLLLTNSLQPANPNLQTLDNETPLHCAAQHGHTGALTTLLAYGADPNIQNNRGETPLDLAAQYGRLQAVQMLIRAHPELLLPYKNNIATNNGEKKLMTQSPLHLASRNGHKHVVEILLAAGVNVNLLTTSGTSLHEAAICGKDNVVRALLDAGADLDATDINGRTALDLLEQFPPHVTIGIVSVINNHRVSPAYDREINYGQHEENEKETLFDYETMSMSLGTGDIVQSSNENSLLPLPNQLPPTATAATITQSIATENLEWRIDTGNFCHSSDGINKYLSSPSTETIGKVYNNKGTPSELYFMSNDVCNISPTPPSKPPRRKLSVSPTTQSFANKIQLSSSTAAAATSGVEPCSGICTPFQMSQSMDEYAPIKDRLLKPYEYEYLYLSPCDNNISIIENSGSFTSLRINLFDDNENNYSTAATNKNVFITANFDNPNLRSYNSNRKLRRNRLDDNSDSTTIDTNNKKWPKYHMTRNLNSGNRSSTISVSPMSPSHYQQPPTPEHPPPNALHAENCIHERIRPLSQEYKRRSGGGCSMTVYKTDVTTETGVSPPTPSSPPIVSAPLTASPSSPPPPPPPSSPPLPSTCVVLECLAANIIANVASNSLETSRGGSLNSVFSISDRSASTADCVEEYFGDMTFAVPPGLFKGSTMTLDDQYPA